MLLMLTYPTFSFAMELRRLLKTLLALRMCNGNVTKHSAKFRVPTFLKGLKSMTREEIR